MIESTFLLLQGIGETTERRWWETGILHWSEFLRLERISGVSPARKEWYDRSLERASVALDCREARYFASHLRTRDHWRLFPLFWGDAVCLDIETTGGDPSPSSLTVVGIHRNGRSLQLIADRGLSEHTVNDALAGAPMLITFFGSVFDIPFLTRVFPQLSVPPLHFDLCFAARRIGLRGGLKSVERALGLTRTMDIMGLGGWDAVVLWQQYRRGNPRALERLLRYNSADTEHLAPLAHHLYGMLARQLGPSIWPHHALPQA